MNTTAIGNQFESAIADYFTSEIENGRFVSEKRCCKVLRKKGYYSRDRSNDIIFDVAIEISLPGAQSYSLVWIIECKNYTSPVPVSDIEEFFAKLQQIGGANCKGVVASTGPFQEAALAYAKSKGIGLIRQFPNEGFKWTLERSPSASATQGSILRAADIYQGLTQDCYRSRYFDFFLSFGSLLTVSIRDFFKAMLIQSAEENIELAGLPLLEAERAKVPFIARDEIEKISSDCLRSVSYLNGPVPLDEICQALSSSCGLTLRNEGHRRHERILGMISFQPLEITIFPDENLGRARFTLAHELGHLLLGHDRHMLGEECEEEDWESEYPTSFQLGLKDISRMEWQANFFSSCLLLPRKEFLQSFFIQQNKFGLREKGFGQLYVDDQVCNQNSYKLVSGALMNQFQVSRSVVKHRLTDLGLVQWAPDLRSLGEHFNQDQQLFKRL